MTRVISSERWSDMIHSRKNATKNCGHKLIVLLKAHISLIEFSHAACLNALLALLYFVPGRRGLVLQHLETQTFLASSISGSKSWHHGKYGLWHDMYDLHATTKIQRLVFFFFCLCMHACHPRVLTCALQRCKHWLFLDLRIWHNPPHKGMGHDMCSFTTFCILLLNLLLSYFTLQKSKCVLCEEWGKWLVAFYC